MPMTRQQRRHQAIVARYHAEKAKPPTRRQAQAWLAPIRKALDEMRSGEVDAYRGYAITRIHHADNDFARVDHAINGFVALIERLLPDLDIGCMRRVSAKLTNGVLLTLAELDTCTALLNTVEDRLIKIPRRDLTDAANTEMIRIELEQLGMIQEAA